MIKHNLACLASCLSTFLQPTKYNGKLVLPVNEKLQTDMFCEIEVMNFT